MPQRRIESEYDRATGKGNPDEKCIVDLIVTVTSEEKFRQFMKVSLLRLQVCVRRISQQTGKHFACLLRGLRARNNRRIARKPHEGCLGKETCRPSIISAPSQPRRCPRVEGMVWPGERKQNVRVQKKCFHSSSQARRSERNEIMEVPSGTANVGNRLPLLGTGRSVARMARRMSCEITAPEALA